MTTAKELLKELVKPCSVFVYVRFTRNDMCAYQAVKADVIWNLKQLDPETEVIAFKDANGDWYIG